MSDFFTGLGDDPELLDALMMLQNMDKEKYARLMKLLDRFYPLDEEEPPHGS